MAESRMFTSPPGVLILEELAYKKQNLKHLRDALGCTTDVLWEFLDGRRSIVPVAPSLSRFFGTSVSFWVNLGNQWDISFQQESALNNPKDSQAETLQGEILIGDRLIWKPGTVNLAEIEVTRIVQENDDPLIFTKTISSVRRDWVGKEFVNDESRIREACVRATEAD